MLDNSDKPMCILIRPQDGRELRWVPEDELRVPRHNINNSAVLAIAGASFQLVPHEGKPGLLKHGTKELAFRYRQYKKWLDNARDGDDE